MENEKLLTLPQVKEYIPFGTTKIYELIKTGDFPKQNKIGGSSLWRLSEIQKWIENNINKTA